MRTIRIPYCRMYKQISKRQDKNGVFYCRLKKENTHINRCKGCKHLNEITRDAIQHLKKRCKNNGRKMP